MIVGGALQRISIRTRPSVVVTGTQRIANPRLVGKVTWKPFPGVWGITSLPIDFDPVPSQPAQVKQL